MQIKLRTPDGLASVLYVPVRQCPVRQWLKERGIYGDLYELGYDFVGPLSGEVIELVPVLSIKNGVLTDVDITEFVLRFGQ